MTKRQLSRCIYCPATADAKEHWIPRGLGAFKGYFPLLDRLCGDCNITLGNEVDEEFLRTGEIGFQRKVYGLIGRDHHDNVNPFLYRAASASPPTVAYMPARSGDHQILAEPLIRDDGQPALKALRQVVVRTSSGVESNPFSRTWAPEHFAAAVAARGLQGATPFEVYLETDERPETAGDSVRAMLTPVFGSFDVTVHGGAGDVDESTTQHPVSATISRVYARGLAKVGFHYFLWTSTLFRGNEDCFAGVRSFIRRDTGDADAFVEFCQPSFLPGHDGSNPLATLSHLFLAQVDAREIISTLQFFQGPLTRTPMASQVRLAIRPPLTFSETTTTRCHVAKFEPADGHDGTLSSVDVWVPRIIPGAP